MFSLTADVGVLATFCCCLLLGRFAFGGCLFCRCVWRELGGTESFDDGMFAWSRCHFRVDVWLCTSVCLWGRVSVGARQLHHKEDHHSGADRRQLCEVILFDLLP